MLVLSRQIDETIMIYVFKRPVESKSDIDDVSRTSTSKWNNGDKGKTQ